MADGNGNGAFSAEPVFHDPFAVQLKGARQ